jgi:hypothetical protein
MAEKLTITCDECAVERRDANHWFAVREGGVGFAVAPLRAVEERPDFFSPEAFKIHICGESCLHKRLARFCAALNSTPTPAQEIAHDHRGNTTG